MLSKKSGMFWGILLIAAQTNKYICPPSLYSYIYLMTSGNRLSQREKDFIIAHHHEYSHCYLAQLLGEKFSADNGGKRNYTTIHRFLAREGIEDE